MAATSRKTSSTPRKTAARTPRELAPSVHEPLADGELDAAEAQEAEATGTYITVALCGEGLRVIPAGAWPVSAQRILRQGDFDGFMEAVLHEEDYELYEEIDPTLDEINLFIEDAGNLSGEPQGKSRGPARSSRRTRRR
ncbi:hypothetical protein ACWGDX_13040 [Streptomyces sp. NPDC055025]